MDSRRLGTLAGLVMGMFASSPVEGALREFTGTIAITERSGNTYVPLISVSGSGIGASNRSGPNEIRSFTAVSGFTGEDSTPYPFGGGGVRIEVTGIGDPIFVGTAITPMGGLGGLGGPLSVRGEFRQYTTSGASAPFMPLVTSQGAVGLGLGGTVPFAGPFTQSVRFAEWTAGTVVETSVVTPASGLGTITAMGFDLRTASGMGSVELVTPTRIIASSEYPDRVFITTLTLQFAPEPTRAVLLLSGTFATVLLGKRRNRPRASR